MITQTLSFIKNTLNSYLKLKTNNDDDKVVLTNIVSQDGTTTHLPENSILLTLINVEEEKVGKSQTSYIELSNGVISKINPEIKLNLYLLFSANFGEDKYNEALKFLSLIISFFQNKNVFNHQNSPELNEKIEKIIVDLYTLNLEQQNHLWAALGAKYMPSVVYKIRMLTIQELEVKTEAPSITEVTLKDN